MRLFVGIALDAATTAALGGVRERFTAAGGESVRWASETTWHVTLQFLGEASAEQAACVVERLRGVKAERVPVRIAGLGFFERAGIFFADVEVTAEMLALEQKVTAATRGCGFVPEARAYHPHITLAKAKGRNARGMEGLRRAVEKTHPIRQKTADKGGAPGGGGARGLSDSPISEHRGDVGHPEYFLRTAQFVAGEFLLYESFPGAEGSRYEVRERFGLRE